MIHVKFTKQWEDGDEVVEVTADRFCSGEPTNACVLLFAEFRPDIFIAVSNRLPWLKAVEFYPGENFGAGVAVEGYDHVVIQTTP